MGGGERRTEVRKQSEQPEAAMVTILQAGAHPHVTCLVLNRSSGGMCLHFPTAIDRGSLIQIRLKEAIFMAEVRYCIPAIQSYQVGVVIREVMPRTS